ncbi:MAG TPA: alpha/beta fold hydrolase [Rhodocyclaceae bacterium]|nr:alpha/beta fold hydrolase [Rhodocyclaceae bacterium]
MPSVPSAPTFLIKLLRLFVIAYLIVIGGILMFQDNLLYFPAKVSLAEMSGSGLTPWPSAQDFRGWLAEPRGTARATVVLFHGNAGHAGDRRYYAEELTRLGFRTLLAEYPAYGPRDGKLGEASFVADAEQTLALAHRRFGAPLLVAGESLGAGVAAAAAGRQRDILAGLMLITPWDSLESVAAHHYPWLPVKMLMRDRYDSVQNLRSFGHPIHVVIAERDTIVPARFGQALFDSLAPPKKLSLLLGAEHNDWIGYADEAWWREAMGYLLREIEPTALSK